ncbi:MAG: nucleotide exchange factor GrpE [Chthoniobacterales bacterium]|nr:nucleotide exchange factor GrpE [Chthoniobacterales bacterium]
MSEVTEIDFASAMSELSGQASGTEESRVASGISILISGIHALGQRVDALEETMVRQFEGLHFQKIEQQLAALRNSESVNQKLFDSLHEELISYRDNFVRDLLQKPFIRDLLGLFDDLNRLAAEATKHAAGEGANEVANQLRANVENTLHSLVEILHRLEVSEIEEKETVDRTLHRVISVEKADSVEEDGRIVTRLKRGFIWRDKVLRPEEVVVRRFS